MLTAAVKVVHDLPPAPAPSFGLALAPPYTVQAAPRGVFVCGNTSTASGLTVTLSRLLQYIDTNNVKTSKLP